MKKTKQTNYKHRIIARITIEAKSPLAIGTGSNDLLTDAPVATDVNGLPFIPGTALAGILRHALGKEGDNKNDKNIFGFQDNDKGHGSEIIFTDAVMVGKDGPIDGLTTKDLAQDKFLVHYLEMPIRQHVKINEFGTAEDGAKFDNQVVYAGTRFLFEIELCHDGNPEKQQQFDEALRQLRSTSLRIGGGTRKGYGEIEVVSCKKRSLDLTKEDDLNAYLAKSSKLTCELPGMVDFCETAEAANWATYELELHPDDFFLFGSGMGDDAADMTPVTEEKVTWESGGPEFKGQKTLIPASSIKGALAHRTAFHWNKLNKLFVGNENAKTGDDNPAVKAIFGSSGNGQTSAEITRGRILLSDIFAEKKQEKIVNHVAIDRFTGGAIEGALFTEKVTYGKDQTFAMNILVEEKAFEDDSTIKAAFEQTLKDICTGMLPLGGGVNRGNGIFNGKVKLNGTEL